MQDFKRGTARANQLTFEYLTQGEGPLALCVHGFPDSPYSYRYLLPALAEAGVPGSGPVQPRVRPHRTARRPSPYPLQHDGRRPDRAA